MEQKNFEFFLFENFDAADILTENNPRTYLNHSITGILSDVVNAVPFTCRYQDMCSQYTSERINNLIKIGLFRTVNDMLLLDSTVIVREDIKVTLAIAFMGIGHILQRSCKGDSDIDILSIGDLDGQFLQV